MDGRGRDRRLQLQHRRRLGGAGWRQWSRRLDDRPGRGPDQGRLHLRQAGTTAPRPTVPGRATRSTPPTARPSSSPPSGRPWSSPDAYSYNTAGGSAAPLLAAVVPDGSTITLAAAPTKAGFTFGRLERRHRDLRCRGELHAQLSRRRGHHLHRSVDGRGRDRRPTATTPPAARRRRAGGSGPRRLSTITLSRRGPDQGRLHLRQAGTMTPRPTVPGRATRSRAAARPSSSRPSGRPTRLMPTASTPRAARRPRRRARASTARPSPCQPRRRGPATPSAGWNNGDHHLQRRCHLHPLERRLGHRLHGPVERQRH